MTIKPSWTGLDSKYVENHESGSGLKKADPVASFYEHLKGPQFNRFYKIMDCFLLYKMVHCSLSSVA